MKRIIISFILILSAVTLSFITASCDKNETNDADSPANPPEGEQSPSDLAENSEEIFEFVPAEGADYGGYKFRILGYDGSDKGLWQIMHISEIIAEEQMGEPINDAVYTRNREVEALYNIEIVVVPTTVYPEDFTPKFTKAVMAGEDLFDAAFLRGANLPAALSTKNMAHDLFSIASLQLDKSWWDQNSIKSMSIGGKINAAISDSNLYSAIAPLAVYANKKIIEDNDIGDLYKLVKEGKWTWDVMYDTAKKATKDLDGDGTITDNDQIGLFMQYFHIQGAINSAGYCITPKNGQDIPEYAPNIEMISNIANVVVPFFKDKEAAIAADDIRGYNNQFYDFILPKFRDNQILFHINQLLFSFDLRNMDADFAILPFPKYDENQTDYGSVVASWWGTYTVIPITCDNTERTANILDAMGYYSQKYVMPAYYDRTVTNKLLRDDEAAEMMDIILNNRVFDLAELYNWGDINQMLSSISSSGKPDTIVSQLEKIEPKINSAIQKTLDELLEN